MKLLTKEILDKIPNIHGQSGMDARVYVKFFQPWGSWTWYATEYDPEGEEFFGYVDGLEGELGYWRLGDLTGIEGPFGLRIERDKHWNDKTTLAEVMR